MAADARRAAAEMLILKLVRMAETPEKRTVMQDAKTLRALKTYDESRLYHKYISRNVAEIVR
jgi:hypothetical protein